MSQVKITSRPNEVRRSRKNSAVIEGDSYSRSKPEDTDESYSETPNVIRKEMPPVQPPPSRVVHIDELKEDEPKKPRRKTSSVKSEKSRSRRRSRKNSAEEAIEPAPQLLFGGDNEEEKPKKHRKRRVRDPSKGESRRKRRSRKGSEVNNDRQNLEKNQLTKSTDLLKAQRKDSQITPRVPHRSDSQAVFPKQATNPVPKKSEKPKKGDSLDDLYVTILTIPTELPELPQQNRAVKLQSKMPTEKPPPIPQKNRIKEVAQRKLPTPVFPSGRGDGLTPLVTIAETTEAFTNAFGEDKYDAAPRRFARPPSEAPVVVTDGLRFQVPLIPRTDDIEVEREASRAYDIARLLHQTKTC